MELELTKEQKMFRAEIIEFAHKNLNDPAHLQSFSPEMWRTISEYGLLGIVVDEKYGGLGESFVTAAAVIEALGYACKNNGFIFAVNNHIWVSQNMIFFHGSEQLREKYLYDMVKGKRIGAIAITEAESGSDALSMRTTATEKGDSYILNGSKIFISNGPIADIFLVFAVTKSETKREISAFVVEKGFDGFEVSPDIEKMGLGACPTSEIVMRDCEVPKENILGGLSRGEFLMTSALEWERCYEFVPHLGAMQRIMESCVEHVTSRRQFGKHISEFQAVSHKIANMKSAIEMARLMMYKIAWLKDQGKKAFLETSIFKLFVSEAYINTCRDALQLFGAYGYTTEYEIERELRDSLASSIYSGTNEMQRNTIYNMAALSTGIS